MIQLICSEDEFPAEEAVEALRAKLPAGAETVALSAEGGDLPGLEEALFAPSLFASERLVVIRGGERLNAAGTKRLAEAAARGGFVGEVAVVAVGERPPSGLVKALEGQAKVHKVARPKRGELIAWVQRRFKLAGVGAGREVPGLLVETVGSSLRELAQAVEQLATHAGRGKVVERQDVAAHFQGTGEQPVWALFDAVSAGDGRKAFGVLHALIAQGDDPIAILFALVSQVRAVMRARSALERSPGLSDADLARALAVSPGRAGVLRRQAGRLSWEWLLALHRLCADADFDLKGGDEVRVVGVLPPVMVLERLILSSSSGPR